MSNDLKGKIAELNKDIKLLRKEIVYLRKENDILRKQSAVDNDAFNSVAGYASTDLNGDDFVDASDLSIVDNNAFNGIRARNPIVGDYSIKSKSHEAIRKNDTFKK